MLCTAISKYQKSLILMLIGIVFILLRIVYLDSDIPLLQITEYLAIDEMYYTIPAFNLYHYGQISYQIIPYIEDDGGPLNFFENIATYLTLKVFGNNYFGLRVASVLAALVVFWLLYLILKNILNQNGKYNRNIVIIAALLYIIFDFSFILAGRIAEPTIFRQLALCFILYIGSLKKSTEPLTNPFISMMLGFISALVVVYVYIYNLFILPAVFVTILIISASKNWRNAAKQAFYFLIGTAICFISFVLFIHIFFGQGLIDIYKSLLPYSSRMGIETSIVANWTHYVHNFVAIFTTNFFRLDVAVLFIFLISLPIFIYKSLKDKLKFDILVLNLLFFLVLQSIVINDFNFRKMLILQPLVIIIVAIAFDYSTKFFKNLDVENNNRKFNIVKLYWFLMYFITFFIHIGSIYPRMLNPNIIVNANQVMPPVIIIINLIAFLFIFILLTMYFFAKKYKFNKILIIGVLILLYVPNIILDYKYIYSNPTYEHRDLMIKISEIVDGRVLAGGWSFGFRLYNDSIPVLNSYKFVGNPNGLEEYHRIMKRIFQEDDADYVISFSNDDYSVANFKKLGFVIVKTIGTINIYKYET